MNKKTLFLVGSILLQFAVLFGMIFLYQSIVIGGREIILKTEPVDPRDILRGKYVALRYDISTIKSEIIKDFCVGPENCWLANGSDIYVTLAEKGGGIWSATEAGRYKPVSGLFLKGEVRNIASSRGISVSYGIESYFVDPERAQELDQSARRGWLLMRVVVDKNGKGVLRGIAEHLSTPSFENAQARSRDARRITDIKQLQLALELYENAEGQYPVSLEMLQPKFIPNVPQDPEERTPYHYFRCTLNSYHIGADLGDLGNRGLTNDHDKKVCNEDTIIGDDAVSCTGEVMNRYCYDAAEGSDVPGGKKIRVIAPNGGERLCLGKSYSLQFESSGIQKARAVIRAEGSNKDYKITNIAPGSDGRGNATWVVGNILNEPGIILQDGKNYKIRIVSTDGGKSVSDVSDGAFTILRCQ